jgi:hypothetical protein
MTLFQTAETSFVERTLTEAVRFACDDAATLEVAAQRVCGIVFETFSSSVLVRAFATVPLQTLPAGTREQVTALSNAIGIAPALTPTTPVFALLGTRGKAPSWNDRKRSEQHFGLPLVSAEFVSAIPMMSRLLDQLGVGSGWLENGAGQPLGNLAGLFHTADAKLATDAEGRLVIPAREFVEQHDVRSVFGVGGTYETGMLLSLICFTAEDIARTAIDKYLPLFVQLRSSTARVVGAGRIFS